MAFDSAGNAFAVWNQYDGTRFNIWANRFDALTGWGSPALLKADDQNDNSTPNEHGVGLDFASGASISMNATGEAMGIWSGPPLFGGPSSIQFNRFVP